MQSNYAGSGAAYILDGSGEPTIHVKRHSFNQTSSKKLSRLYATYPVRIVRKPKIFLSMETKAGE